MTHEPMSAELEGLLTLARRHHKAGQFAEAMAAYQRILAVKPDAAHVHNDLGNVLVQQGKFQRAQSHYECAVALRPDLAPAHHSLGNIFWFQGKLFEAAARYEQVVALMPGSAEAHNNSGNALMALGELDQAAARYERALALKPELIEAQHNLGCVRSQQGRLDEAIAQFERVLALKPDFAAAHNHLGRVYRQQGRLDDARRQFEQALALDPEFAEAHFELAGVTTFQAGDPVLAQLEAVAANPRPQPPRKMLHIHFALGKALDDLGQYDRAFREWLKGNSMKRRLTDYDEAASLRDFRLIHDLFDQALYQRLAGSGDPRPTPIFIVGMPRSGTTLIEQILASHPLVHGAGELTTLTQATSQVLDAAGRPVNYPLFLSTLDQEGCRQLGAAYLDGLPPLPEGKTRITDKMPGNFIYTGLIRLILPGAKIIHTQRNPVDTCVSCFSRLFTMGQPFTYDLAELGRYYRLYSALMDHWRSVLPADAMLEVRYEDVVDDLELHARRLVEYCGLPWDDRCLRFHETRRRIGTASDLQVRQPIYRSSLARWRRYEQHLGPLLAELGELGRSA